MRVFSPHEIGQFARQTLPEALPPGNTLARKKLECSWQLLQAYWLICGRITGPQRGRAQNREKRATAQPNFTWTWCRPPQGPQPRRQHVSTASWGDRALNWNSSREAWAINPKRRERGPSWKMCQLRSNFFQVSLVPDMLGTPDVKTEHPCDHFPRCGTHLKKISLKLQEASVSQRGKAERFCLCARASQQL